MQHIYPLTDNMRKIIRALDELEYGDPTVLLTQKPEELLAEMERHVKELYTVINAKRKAHQAKGEKR